MSDENVDSVNGCLTDNLDLTHEDELARILTEPLLIILYCSNSTSRVNRLLLLRDFKFRMETTILQNFE
jgi:hypothetical protein